MVRRALDWAHASICRISRCRGRFPDPGRLRRRDHQGNRDVGAFRQGAEVRPTTSDAQIRPRRTGGLTANFVAEGASIPESSFQLDAIESAQKKLAILGRASSELFEDSAPDLGEFLTSEIGYAFAAKEDDCGFNGDGTSTFSGINGLATKLVGLRSSVAAASTHKTFASLDNGA